MELREYKYVMNHRGWRTAGIKADPLYLIEMILIQMQVSPVDAQERISRLRSHVENFIKVNVEGPIDKEEVQDFLDTIF